VLYDENGVLPVSSLLDGQYGIDDVCLSLPTIVNGHGIDTVLEASIADEEVDGLRHSAHTVREVARSLGL